MSSTLFVNATRMRALNVTVRRSIVCNVLETTVAQLPRVQTMKFTSIPPQPEKPKESTNTSKEVDAFDYDNYEDYEPKTAGEKVYAYSQLFFFASLLALGSFGIYYVGSALFPGRMSPYSLFGDSFEVLKLNDEVNTHIMPFYDDII